MNFFWLTIFITYFTNDFYNIRYLDYQFVSNYFQLTAEMWSGLENVYFYEQGSRCIFYRILADSIGVFFFWIRIICYNSVYPKLRTLTHGWSQTRNADSERTRYRKGEWMRCRMPSLGKYIIFYSVSYSQRERRTTRISARIHMDRMMYILALEPRILRLIAVCVCV